MISALSGAADRPAAAARAESPLPGSPELSLPSWRWRECVVGVDADDVLDLLDRLSGSAEGRSIL